MVQYRQPSLLPALTPPARLPLATATTMDELQFAGGGGRTEIIVISMLTLEEYILDLIRC